MEEQIKQVIKSEIEAHSYDFDEHHLTEIVNAVFKQLREALTLQELDKLLKTAEHEFLQLVDTLIPVVEEYESKIEQILEEKIGSLVV